jgi:hypothetical protein
MQFRGDRSASNACEKSRYNAHSPTPSERVFTCLPHKTAFVAVPGKQRLRRHEKTALLSGLFCDNYLPFVARRGGRHDVRTFPDETAHIVSSIYHFFRSECMSPHFKLDVWKGLIHEDSMAEAEKN